MTRTTVVGIATLMALAACAPEPTTTPTNATQAFCDEAVPILSRRDLGDSPGPMLEQMMDLTNAAEANLDDQTRDELMVLVDGVNDQLHMAQQGQAENGWENGAVVEFVGSLCGRDDLTTWMVTP